MCPFLPALLLAVLAPALARGGELETVNGVRARGCDTRAGVVAALEHSARLDLAARINADGTLLAQSLRRAGYAVSRSTAIHVSDAGPRATTLAQVLTSRFCAEVTDPAYTEFGSTRRGRDVWIVLARPFAGPTPASAADVGARMRQLVNRARSTARHCGATRFAPAEPVALSKMLGHAALMHARDMARRESMSHAGGDGSNVAQRATRAGYQWRVVAENVAAGQETPEAAMESWLASSGHCSNIMNPQFTEMGVAYATNPGSVESIYWVQVFAAPR